MKATLRYRLAPLALVTGLLGASAANAGLINAGFESPVIGASTFVIIDESTVPGWETTSSDGAIELWSSGFSSLSGGPVIAYEGNQFAEINATQFATLFQDDSGIAAGTRVGFQFAHRGRSGVDTMRLTITDLGADDAPGGASDTVLFSKLYSTGQAWAFYTDIGESPIIAVGNHIRFFYEAVSTASGDSTVGNFIDAADFGVEVGSRDPGNRVPVPGTLALLGLGLAGLLRRVGRTSA